MRVAGLHTHPFGNVDDRELLKSMDFHKRIFGKLFVDGVHLVTKIKKNMKNALMLLQDRILLRKKPLLNRLTAS
jgi:hypothetical protein